MGYCNDCNGKESVFSGKGDGRCYDCNGDGISNYKKNMEDLINNLAFVDDDPDRERIQCDTCSGTGQCQTCGGTGYVKDNDDDEDYDYNDDDDYDDDDENDYRTRNYSSSESTGKECLTTILTFIIGLFLLLCIVKLCEAIWQYIGRTWLM